jgi:hypothetical protein
MRWRRHARAGRDSRDSTSCAISAQRATLFPESGDRHAAPADRSDSRAPNLPHGTSFAKTLPVK